MEASESTINQPHPDDEADLFFGEPEEEETEAAAQPEPEPETEETPDPTPPAESAGPTEEPEPEPEPEPDPSPAEPEATAEEAITGPPAGEDSSASAPAPEGKKSGALEREYVIFHKLPLTEKALRFLLREIEEGRAPEPRVAFFEIHRTEARNVNQAIADAYKRNTGRLGEKCDMAAVSSRAFQEKHVEPRKVVAENLSIT